MIKDDDLYEVDEIFTLKIIATSYKNIIIGRSDRATVTIMNDEYREFLYTMFVALYITYCFEVLLLLCSNL